MPEWALMCYAQMRPRIEADRELAMYGAVIAAGGRAMEDQKVEEYLDRLRRAAEGDFADRSRRQRVRPTAMFLQEMHAAAARSGGG